MTYFITGANRGIGLELTQFALEAGYKVYAYVRNPSHARSLNAAKNEFKDQLVIFQGDVADRSALLSVQEQIKNETIDVLINNAGVFSDNEGDFSKLSVDELHGTFLVNAFAPTLVTQIFLPNLLKSMKPKMVCITSLMGSIRDNTSGGYYAYRMSKAALNMFVKSFSIDYPQICALTLHPGWVRTDMGGAKAPLLPRESARGLFKIIQEATKENSGHFYDYAGKELSW